jgi:hypothetical protein
MMYWMLQLLQTVDNPASVSPLMESVVTASEDSVKGFEARQVASDVVTVLDWIIGVVDRDVEG